MRNPARRLDDGLAARSTAEALSAHLDKSMKELAYATHTLELLVFELVEDAERELVG